jgi:DUF1009 family protein
VQKTTRLKVILEYIERMGFAIYTILKDQLSESDSIGKKNPEK